MKRVCYEWGSILFGGIAICCLVGWAASVWSKHPTPSLNLDGKRYFRIADGCVVFANVCGDPDNSRSWGGIEGFIEYPVRSIPDRLDRSLMIPGLRYRKISVYGTFYDFALEVSLLIPGCTAAIFGVLFGFLYWRFRRSIRLAAKPLAP
jgi:hypothetical protein